jgi:hypothetical protein
MMDNQKIRESDETIECQDAVQDWCYMAARIAKDKHTV